MSLLLIDGDILTYQVGFACQKTFYTVGDRTFKTLKQAVEFKKSSVQNGYAILKHFVVGSASDAEMILRQKINSILKDCGTTEFRIFLTGKGNYRFDIAKFQPYKGNRKPESKPKLYGIIREILVEAYQAEMVEGMEADDKLGILACDLDLKKKYQTLIIASIDKDLKTIPGFHFNLNTKELLKVSTDEANKAFFMQCLTGDAVDNIPSLRQVAKKYAAPGVEKWLSYHSYLAKARTFFDSHTVEECRQYVFNQFRHINAPDEVRNEICNLLFILRSYDESWYNWDSRFFAPYTYKKQEDDLCLQGLMIGKLGLSQCSTTGVLSLSQESISSIKQDAGDSTLHV